MSRTGAQAAPPNNQPVRHVPGRSRRWVWWVAAGLVATAVGGNILLFTHAVKHTPVLVVARDVG